MRNLHHLVLVFALLLGVLVPSVLRASDDKSPLASIERRLQAVYETAAPAIVTILRNNNDKNETPLAAGVIVMVLMTVYSVWRIDGSFSGGPSFLDPRPLSSPGGVVSA